MRRYATIAAAAMLAGCGMAPGSGGPQLTVAGPSESVAAFVRQQGAHRPTRATTFPQSAGAGEATAQVLMPAGTDAAAMAALSREAMAAGLRSTVVAAR